MTRTLTSIGLAGSVLVALSGCANQSQIVETNTMTQQATPAQQKFYHTVFFTVKEGTPDAAIESMVADCYDVLSQVPSVRQIHAGRRDQRMTRDVNVKDYTIGLLVVFDDKAGHDIYNDHPLHIQFVEKHKAHWAGVKVYDFAAR